MDDALNHRDVTPVFQASKDAVHTGASGTWVNDRQFPLVSVGGCKHGFESGLLKMMAIGLGKEKGATI